MTVRALLLALVCGCTVADWTAAGAPDESEAISHSTIAPCPTGQWCVETPSSMTAAPLLYSVWAIDANNVFAVGNNGTILHRLNGNDWTAMSSGTTNDLRAVWGSSPTDVWAGGGGAPTGGPGTLLHYDGTWWSPVSVPMQNVDGIWGSSANSVWFAGSSQILRWNGSSLSNVSTYGGTALSVSGTGPNDVWVTGENGWVRRYNGTTWKNMMPSIGSSMWVVLAITPTDVWASGQVAGRETTHYNGTSWLTFKSAPIASDAVSFYGMSAQASNDVWAVGNSKIGRWNGAAWSLEEPFGTSQQLFSISTVPGHVWIVGSNGLIVHRQL
jgi:hypothetical protein